MSDTARPDDIDAAIARAQQAMEHPKKTKTNPHFKSTYADLADVVNAVRPALNAEGIAVIQRVDGEELVTEFRRGGEVRESRLRLNLDVKPQELGSQMTYLRRFALAGLAGVASEDDDDGNAASASPKRQARPAPPKDPLLAEFQQLCDQLGIDTAKDKSGFIATSTVSDSKWSQLSAEVHRLIIDELEAIADGSKQLLWDNAGRPYAAPHGEPFGDVGE